MRKNYAAVIFDMDGVITLTEPLHAQAERDICAECGFDAPLSEWLKFRGRTANDIFSYLISAYGGGRSWDVEDLIRRKTERYAELCRQGVPAVPGAVDFIRGARRFFPKVALATSSNSSIQRLCFDGLGLWPHFDVVVTGDDLTRGKPHPEAYLKAAARLGVNPADSLVIEDSDNGVRSGVAAGCTVIGLTTELTRESLIACGALATVDTYAELETLLL
jgi:HAD superfamily hydrolase (TIGR01509 family)